MIGTFIFHITHINVSDGIPKERCPVVLALEQTMGRTVHVNRTSKGIWTDIGMEANLKTMETGLYRWYPIELMEVQCIKRTVGKPETMLEWYDRFHEGKETCSAMAVITNLFLPGEPMDLVIPKNMRVPRRQR